MPRYRSPSELLHMLYRSLMRTEQLVFNLFTLVSGSECPDDSRDLYLYAIHKFIDSSVRLESICRETDELKSRGMALDWLSITAGLYFIAELETIAERVKSVSQRDIETLFHYEDDEIRILTGIFTTSMYLDMEMQELTNRHRRLLYEVEHLGYRSA